MEFLLLILFLILLILFPRFRCIVAHPFATVYYAAVDSYKYIRYCRWRECNEFGKCNAYVGSEKVFGSGKTLTGVDKAILIFNKYDGKKVYDFESKQWVIQHIHILSNVELKSIPYTLLIGTDQIIDCHKGLGLHDIVIVLIDEAGSQFNSRHFKDNISSTLLTSMLSCRHEKFGMILTSPLFKQIDALMRDICIYVYVCDKLWRLQLLKRYYARDFENCTDPTMLKCHKSCWFVFDRNYNAYDTNAHVEDIKRLQKNGQLLTDAEVLALQQRDSGNFYNVTHGTSKYKKAVYRK